MNINDILCSVSEEQRVAITTTEGNIRLVAGAGSGKTNALTKRMAYICKSKNISPERILSVTYTNKAAKEMKERVAKLLDEIPSEDELQIMTFHRLALNICKKFLGKIGYPTIEQNGEEIADIVIGATPISAIAKEFFESYDLSMLNEEDAEIFKNSVIRYTKSIIRGHNYTEYLLINNEELSKPEDVVRHEKDRASLKKDSDKKKRLINNLKGEIKKTYEKDEKAYEYLKTIRNYEKEITEARSSLQQSPTRSWAIELLKRKISTKVLDFDDIIMFADYLLTSFADVREYWNGMYDYIQVDEFQDTDYIQLHILKLISENKGLFVVGDPDQSIYLFRGVKPEIFNTLDERIDNLQTIYMENNYRSSDAVIKSANAIIELNKNRLKKNLLFKSGINDMDAPLICTGTDKYTAAQLEFKQIQKMLANGVKPNDICVLYRDKNCDVTDELVRLLKNTDIPLDCQFKRTTFADTFEDITLNLLKYNHSNSKNFLGNLIDLIYGEDYTGVFDETVLNSSVADGDSVFRLIREIYPKKYTKNGSPTGKYKTFEENIEAIKLVIDNTVENWNALSKSEKDKMCSEDSILDNEHEMSDGIHIMTIHKSKGLEFDYVFANLDNGECPKYQFATFDTLEEDVRLAYVAVTRAKKQIYIGFKDIDSMSPFVAISNERVAPIHAKTVNLPDQKGNEEIINHYLKVLSCYYMLSTEGIYELIDNSNTTEGYRYATMHNGSRVYFQTDVKNIKNPIDKKDLRGVNEVMMKGNKIYTFEEKNDTAKVINITNADHIYDLFVEQNPLRCIKNYLN